MLAEFFRVAWQSTASPDEVLAARRRAAAENLSEPGRVPPAQIAIQGERIVGYCGSLAVRFWNGHEERAAYWAKGLMVLEEYRNGPIGFQLVKDLSKTSPLMGSFTVNPASNKLFAALGYRDRGALPNRIRPLRLRRIFGHADPALLGTSGMRGVVGRAARVMQLTGLPTLAGAVLDAGLHVVSPSAGGDVVTATDAVVSVPELDALWQRTRERLPAATVRDGRGLVQRYGDGASHPDYRAVTVHRGGTLVGVAYVRRPRIPGDPRLGGIRVASLSDLLAEPTDVGAITALLAGSERCGVALTADALICSVTYAPLAALLKRRGYVNAPSNVHFFLKTPAADTSWAASVDQWWLSRGDSEADANF